MRTMFQGCYNIPFLNVSKWNTSNCTDMSYMFMSYTENKQGLPMKFTSLDVSNWDTSKVTNMSSMFSDCKMLNLDCSKWNINKVTNHKGFNSKAPNVIAPIWIS